MQNNNNNNNSIADVEFDLELKDEEAEAALDEVELPMPQAAYPYIEDDFALAQSNAAAEAAAATAAAAAAIPDVVFNFLRHFQSALADRSVHDLHGVYENSFNKITEKFYNKQAWPSVEAVVSLLGSDDPIFAILYKELYYRHIYSKLTPSLEDRFNSYANYCDLFNYILNSPTDEPSDLELPNQWLWDIIDEFIYQFQSFCHFRAKLYASFPSSSTASSAATSVMSPDDLTHVQSRPDVWNVLNVLNVLYSLIQKSNIQQQLAVSRHGGDMVAAGGEYGSRPLYRMLGYFSLVGLLRVHCLLGDYTMALKTMEGVDLVKKGLFARVTACHVSTYYYVGFAYMMMRRYSDAVKAFAHVLMFVARTKQYHSRSYQYEVISKKSDQMYALLAMCVSLSPQRIDENVHSVMREKHGEQLNKMQKDADESLPVFEELFRQACPKFISPAPPKLDGSSNPHAATALQLRVFLAEVKQQSRVPIIRSYLKLYTTLRVDKLASFIADDASSSDSTTSSARSVMTALLVYKHKTRQRRWESGCLLDGVYATSSDLDFCVKQDMIHITEIKASRRVGDWFIRHTAKFEDIITSLQRGR